MGEEEVELVPVFDFLVSLGFSETDATDITLYALLRSFAATVDEIKVASQDCGFALPPVVMLPSDLKDRN